MKTYTFILFLLLSLSVSCSKEPGVPNGNVMPDPIVFVLLDKQGDELFTSEDTPIQVSSFNKAGQRFYIKSNVEYPDGKIKMIQSIAPTTEFPYHFFYASLGMPLASGDGSKEWYLELNGKTDTLHYDVRHTRPNALYNQYDVIAVSFNGQPVEASGDPRKRLYYVLRRQR